MSHLRTQAAVSPFYELRSEAVAEVVRPRARHAGLFRVELIRRPAMDAQAASKRSRMFPREVDSGSALAQKISFSD